MSGQTVAGKALQFTNDNKFCYSNSGALTITSGYTDAFNFTTNSEYILAEFQISSIDATSSDLFFKTTINGVVIQNQIWNNAIQNNPYGFYPVELLIPPHSNVVIQAQRGTGSDYIVYFTLRGKVGMPQRVGNLDE